MREKPKISNNLIIYSNDTFSKSCWTISDDKLLIQLAEKYGFSHWNIIASYFQNKKGKQCRERWYNNLCPDVNKSPWTLEEETLLLLLHNKIGNKWSKLSKYLKGRTDNNIKNYWNSNMKKRHNFANENLKNKLSEIKKRFKKENQEIIEKLLINELIEIINKQMKSIKINKKIAYENYKNLKQTNENILEAKKLREILGYSSRLKKSKNLEAVCLVNKEKIKNDIYNNNKFELKGEKNNPFNICNNNFILKEKNELNGKKEMNIKQLDKKNGLYIKKELNIDYKINTINEFDEIDDNYYNIFNSFLNTNNYNKISYSLNYNEMYNIFNINNSKL